MRVKRQILFISDNFPPVIGGSSVVYDQICKRLANHIVALGSSRFRTLNPLPDHADAQCGYLMHRLPYLHSPEIAGKRLRLRVILDRVTIDLPIMIRTLIRVVSLIVRYRVKVVCLGELLSTGWLVFPLRYLLRRRVLIYTHGEEITQENDWKIGRMRGTFLRHANAIVAVSRFCKGQIVARFQIDPERISVIGNGVDLSAFQSGTRDRSCLPEHIRTRRIILSVGRLVARKGHEKLLRAMPQIMRHIPSAHYLVVGEGPLDSKLRSLVSDLGIDGHCTFLGSVLLPELVRLYRACDVFALPCHTLSDGDTEGFGLVFLEANACGVPVVAGAAGGTIEAVADRTTGLLIDANHGSELADAVTEVLSDEALAARLVSGGRQWAAQHGWQPTAEKFLRLCMESPQPSIRGYQRSIAALPTDDPQLRTAAAPSLLVTIDVEEQFAWAEFHRDRYTVGGVSALARFHESCAAMGVSPVYMLSWPIMQNEAFLRFFSTIHQNKSCELGIHLHSWVTPPFWEEPNIYTSYQCNLPEHVERRKLETLCATFENAFGYRPSIHRAGRWGGTDRTSDLLNGLGITVDFSPVAMYSDPLHIAPDFSNLEGLPFWSGSTRGVLTIPASTVSGIRGPDWISGAYYSNQRSSRTRRWLERALGSSAPVRFSPEGISRDMLMTIAQEIHRCALPVAVFSLHSTSLYSGGNPYARDEKAARAMHATAISIIGRCLKEGLVVPSRTAEIYASYLVERNGPQAGRSLPSSSNHLALPV